MFQQLTCFVFRKTKPGSGRKRRKVQKEAKAAKYISKNEKKLVVHKYLGKVRDVCT